MRLALATVAVLPLAVLAQAQDNVTAPATNATVETNSTITPNATVNGNGTTNGTVHGNGTHPNGTTNGTHPSSPATSKPSSGSTAVVPVTFGVGVAGLAMLLGVL